MAQTHVDIEHLKRARKRRDYGAIAITIFLSIGALVSLLPLVYLVCHAFKPMEELFLYPPRFFVKSPTTKNFSDLMNITSESLVPFSRYLFNTILITVAYLFLLVWIGTMACYPLSKHKFPGQKALFTTVTTALMFVAAAAGIPLYIINTRLGLVDRYWVYIIPGLANPTCLFLLKQFLDQVPDSIFEAGKIDGASEWQLYTRIALPLLRNAQATVVILTFGGIWGDAGTATTYIYREQLKTLAFFMTTIGGGIARAGAQAASALIMVLPGIIMFILQQSRVMDTMAHSGIK
ncbi:MAG TPA: carbohydrate ABC transporter permease [Clostridiaceae bacterium]|jgi:ABC-type glycerol-3-phosphate transport system permease component|nr:carbohydrate ABC transporter permease [Clostridiaceae bacterium]HOA31002.1 carbohydrate ABC transporter permease [Clostridia bacterium]